MDGRECKYLSGAADVVSSWRTASGNESGTVHLLLLNAINSALEGSTAFKLAKQPPVDLELIRDRLSSEAVTFVESIQMSDGSSARVLILSEQLDAVPSPVVYEHLYSKLDDLEATADKLCAEGLKAGWKLRAFLARHFKQHLQQSFDIQLEKAANLESRSLSGHHDITVFDADSDDVLQYINVIVDGLDNDEQLQYMRDLLAGLSGDQAPFGRLLAVHRLVDTHGGK